MDTLVTDFIKRTSVSPEQAMHIILKGLDEVLLMVQARRDPDERFYKTFKVELSRLPILRKALYYIAEDVADNYLVNEGG